MSRMQERKNARHDPRDVTTPMYLLTYILRMTYALFVDKQTDQTINRSKDGRANNETSVEKQLRSIVIDQHEHCVVTQKYWNKKREEERKKNKKKKKKKKKRGYERIQRIDNLILRKRKTLLRFVTTLRYERVT